VLMPVVPAMVTPATMSPGLAPRRGPMPRAIPSVVCAGSRELVTSGGAPRTRPKTAPQELQGRHEQAGEDEVQGVLLQESLLGEAL